MAAVAHNPAFAKKMGIPQSVGEDFTSADKGMKLSGGAKSRANSQAVNEPKTQHGGESLFKKGGIKRWQRAVCPKLWVLKACLRTWKRDQTKRSLMVSTVLKNVVLQEQ